MPTGGTSSSSTGSTSFRSDLQPDTRSPRPCSCWPNYIRCRSETFRRMNLCFSWAEERNFPSTTSSYLRPGAASPARPVGNQNPWDISDCRSSWESELNPAIAAGYLRNMHSPGKRDRVLFMTHDLPSTGETQMLPIEERHGFVDNCIKLIENLLDGRDL